MNDLSEVFFIFLVSGILTWLGLVTRYCYKTKCKLIECCGIQIIRDVEGEEKEDDLRRRMDSSSTISIMRNTPSNQPIQL